MENSNDATTIESSYAESENVVVLSKEVEDKKFRENKEQQNLDAQEDHSVCENVAVAKHNDDGHGVIKLIGEKNLDQPAQDLQKHVPPKPLVSIQSSLGSTEKTSENRKLVEKEGEKPKRKHFITFFNKKAFLPVKKPPQKKVKFFKKGQIDANEHPICDGPDHHRLPGFLPPALKVAPGEYILPPAFEIEQQSRDSDIGVAIDQNESNKQPVKETLESPNHSITSSIKSQELLEDNETADVATSSVLPPHPLEDLRPLSKNNLKRKRILDSDSSDDDDDDQQNDEHDGNSNEVEHNQDITENGNDDGDENDETMEEDFDPRRDIPKELQKNFEHKMRKFDYLYESEENLKKRMYRPTENYPDPYEEFEWSEIDEEEMIEERNESEESEIETTNIDVDQPEDDQQNDEHVGNSNEVEHNQDITKNGNDDGDKNDETMEEEFDPIASAVASIMGPDGNFDIRKSPRNSEVNELCTHCEMMVYPHHKKLCEKFYKLVVKNSRGESKCYFCDMKFKFRNKAYQHIKIKHFSKKVVISCKKLSNETIDEYKKKPIENIHHQLIPEPEIDDIEAQLAKMDSQDSSEEESVSAEKKNIPEWSDNDPFYGFEPDENYSNKVIKPSGSIFGIDLDIYELVEDENAIPESNGLKVIFSNAMLTHCKKLFSKDKEAMAELNKIRGMKPSQIKALQKNKPMKKSGVIFIEEPALDVPPVETIPEPSGSIFGIDLDIYESVEDENVIPESEKSSINGENESSQGEQHQVSTVQMANEGTIDLESPDSILTQTNMRTLLNKSTNSMVANKSKPGTTSKSETSLINGENESSQGEQHQVDGGKKNKQDTVKNKKKKDKKLKPVTNITITTNSRLHLKRTFGRSAHNVFNEIVESVHKRKFPPTDEEFEKIMPPSKSKAAQELNNETEESSVNDESGEANEESIAKPSTVLKQRTKIKKKILPLQVKGQLIQESKSPGMTNKKLSEKYEIDKSCVSKILKNQLRILTRIEEEAGKSPELEKHWYCEVCGKMCKTKKSLRNHKMHIHDKIFNYPCPTCGKGFIRPSTLKKHTQLVHEGIKKGPRPFKCDVCEEKFESGRAVAKHFTEAHPGQKMQFPCSMCDKSYASKMNLKGHMKCVHQGIRFKCVFCDKLFTMKRSLKRHIRIVHEKKKEFKCETCSKFFPRKEHLKRHILTVHEGRKEFDCEFCGKSFTEKGVLKRHIYTIHEGHKDYECKFCEKSFSQKEILKRHIRKVHEGQKK